MVKCCAGNPSGYQGNTIAGYQGNTANYNTGNPSGYQGNTIANYNTGNAGTYNAPVLGNPGGNTTVLGVYFPGGAGGSANYNPAPGSTIAGYNAGQLAPTVGETVTNYWAYPDNATYPVDVPVGGQIVVKIE